MSHVKCSKCGKQVSNEVPERLIVRAWIECPECIELEKKLSEAHTDRIIKLAGAEDNETREKAQKWDKLKSLFETSCDKCFLNYICGSHLYPGAVCKDINDALEGGKG